MLHCALYGQQYAAHALEDGHRAPDSEQAARGMSARGGNTRFAAPLEPADWANRRDERADLRVRSFHCAEKIGTDVKEFAKRITERSP